MKLFEKLKNDRGLTLLEVLLSIVILTIILVSIMNFFPQMGKINKQNEEKLESINLMKTVLNEWQSDEKVIKLLKEEIDTTEFNNLINEPNESEPYYKFEQSLDGFKVIITVAKQSELENSDADGNIKAHRTIITLYNKDEHQTAETYGYITFVVEDDKGSGE